MRKYIVVLNTGEAPVSESLFAACGHREDPVKQVFSKSEAERLAESLDGVGSKNVREDVRPMMAEVVPLSDPCVLVNERTGYVRIDLAFFQFPATSLVRCDNGGV